MFYQILQLDIRDSGLTVLDTFISTPYKIGMGMRSWVVCPAVCSRYSGVVNISVLTRGDSCFSSIVSNLRMIMLLYLDICWPYLQSLVHFCQVSAVLIWAPSSEFVSSSIPSWQTLTAHAQPFRGARDLAFCLKVPLDSPLVWASSEGSGETARMRRLAWTFAARIGYKYQIRLTRSIFRHYFLMKTIINYLKSKEKCYTQIP